MAAAGDSILGMPDEISLPAVLLTGGPGAGKSTVGRALARRLGAALVDQDTVTGPLVVVVANLIGVHDLDDARLAGPTRQARYEAVIAVAEDNLRVGTPVVLVAPFTHERREGRVWAGLDRRLRAAGGSPLLVWLHLDPAAAARRLGVRGAARDLSKRKDVEADPEDPEPAGAHLAVDAERSTEDMVATVVAALVNPGPS